MLASNNAKNIASVVRQIAEPLAQQMGYSVWDVEFVKEGAEKYLRITLDKPDGISIDDCEAFHRAIDPLLDEANPIEESYYLEVSSPGIEREIRTEEQVFACEGMEVEVKLFTGLEGRKTLRGTLTGMDEDKQILLTDADGKEWAIDRKNISKMNTVYDFEQDREYGKESHI